jgi:hypothetical protein
MRDLSGLSAPSTSQRALHHERLAPDPAAAQARCAALRIHRLTEAAHLIWLVRPADPDVARIKPDSRNEPRQPSLAKERLRVPINLAVAYLKQRK